jgi:hypothetical protein
MVIIAIALIIAVFVGVGYIIGDKKGAIIAFLLTLFIFALPSLIYIAKIM